MLAGARPSFEAQSKGVKSPRVSFQTQSKNSSSTPSKLALPPISGINTLNGKSTADQKNGGEDGLDTGRRSQGSKDDSSSITSSAKSSRFEEEEDSDDDGDANPSGLKIVNRFMARQAKAFVRNFIDYGPPYSKTKPFDVALINECSKPRLNHYEVHNLLNKRLDPNIPDPDDLYYVPIHWCARNAHLMGMQMLRRAGARVNITTEMGNTPLDLAVMMKHPPDRRKKQIKSILYLLKNGADVNTRDKGGYGPIDHAAANNDLEIIELLLEAGAKLRRENTILVAKRHPVLKSVYDPACYKILYERLLEEEQEFRREAVRRERYEGFIQDDKKIEKLHHDLNKRKLKKEARLKALLDATRDDDIRAHREAKIRQEMEAGLERKAFEQSNVEGLYKKDESGHWLPQIRRPFALTSAEIYAQNEAVIVSIHAQNNLENYDSTWRQVTHGGRLEMPWARGRVFEQLDAVKEERARRRQRELLLQQQQQMMNDGDSLGLSALSFTAFDDLDEDRSLDIDYRDENDAALEGEGSLDDLLSDLRTLKS